MAESSSSKLPSVLLFNINGNGMGHLSTCLAYANRLKGRARPVFFSLASAIEIIEEMGYEADYFVSRFWSRATSWVWDQQLSLRLGLMLDRVRPDVIVFDGNWPYRGLRSAASAYGEAKLVWSNLSLFRTDAPIVPVSEREFDLVVHLGEIGSSYEIESSEEGHRCITVPPVAILKNDELLGRAEARASLGLSPDTRYVLFSLGPGNLKDVTGIGRGLLDEFRSRGYTAVWARAPISARDIELPDDVLPITAYPLARYMNAFDLFVGAAGYNTCSEVLQTAVPTLFVPNTQVADDQSKRGRMIAAAVPSVVSPCETAEQRSEAVDGLLALTRARNEPRVSYELNGADIVAEEILAMIGQDAA